MIRRADVEHILTIFVITAIMFWLMTMVVWGHEKYPPLCCNGDGTAGDCHPVACDELVETKEGVDWRGVHFSTNMVHPSMDADCHVCAFTSGSYANYPIPRCVFVRPTS